MPRLARRSAAAACLVPILCYGPLTTAQPSAEAPHLATVVISAKHFDPAADAEATTRVQSALHADPYIYDGHISIETRNGVVCSRRCGSRAGPPVAGA